MQVTNGVFTVQLDFGADAFDGNTCFLEISVRSHSADPNSPAYMPLSPRQQVASTPYAMRSSTAVAADTTTTAANFSGSLSGDVTGTPTGSVQFKANGSTLGDPVALGAGGSAALTTSALPPVRTSHGRVRRRRRFQPVFRRAERKPKSPLKPFRGGQGGNLSRVP